MRAGHLRHLLEFQSPLPVTANSGSTAPAWDEQTPFDVCYGSVSPLRGREAVSADGIASIATHKIERRYKSGITTDMRIKFGSRYFGIESIRNLDERNIMLEIIAVEGAVQGR